MDLIAEQRYKGLNNAERYWSSGSARKEKFRVTVYNIRQAEEMFGFPKIHLKTHKIKSV